MLLFLPAGVDNDIYVPKLNRVTNYKDFVVNENCTFVR